MSFETRLKQWAARHEASPGQLSDLATQVVVEAARHRHANTSAPASSSMPFLGRLGYALTGAVVAGVVFVLCARQGEPQASRSESAAAMAKPTADQVTTVSRLFAETARLFPKQLRWIAQSNGDMGLGVEAADQDWECDTPPMLVRLVIVAKTGTETAWRQVWATDVVLRGEDLAEITPNRDSANKVTLWVYPLQDGKLAVDTGVNLDEPLKIASRLSSVVKNGEPAEVATVRLGDTEYRLFQTVQPLHGVKGRTI